MPNIRVSYVIATRNRSDYLEKTLLNIRDFITSEDELIIVDGKSADRTVELISENKDIVTLFVHEKDGGEAHAFNKGILLARGLYIKVLTDDDYFYPQAMRQAIAAMTDNNDLDAIVCGGESFIFNSLTQKKSLQNYRFLVEGQSATPETIRTQICCGLGLLVKRGVFSRIGFFDPSFVAVDTDFMSRLMHSGLNIKYCHIKLFQHLTHSQSLSGSANINRMLRDEIRVLLDCGQWIDVSAYPESVIGESLGISREPGATDFLRTLKVMDDLRTDSPALLKVLAFIAAVLRILLQFRRKLFTNASSSPASIASTRMTFTNKEPRWDGSLR